MASLHDLTIGQDIEFKRMLASAGMDLEDAEAIIKSPRNILARSLVEWLHEQTGSNALFVSPDQQITNLRQWNDFGHFPYRFTEGDFNSILEARASLPHSNGLTVSVLVPYLGTVGETFDGLWSAVESVYDEHWRYPELKSDKKHLRLAEDEGVPLEEHPGKCLRWEVIDLGAHHEPENGRTVEEVLGSDSAHAGVLAAVAHFPKWVAAMDGTKVPYVDIAGYQCTVPGNDAWRSVPYIDRDGSGVRLSADWVDYSNRSYAAPVRRDCVS